jgi:hypothetical protein
MVLGGPSEKDIEELDESERSSFSNELGVYVSSPFLGMSCPDRLTILFLLNPVTPFAVEVWGILPRATCHTPKAPWGRMAPATRTRLTITSPYPVGAVARGTLSPWLDWIRSQRWQWCASSVGSWNCG